MTDAVVGPATTSTGWASLGLDDPAPGEPADVRAVATRFQGKADDLRSLTEEIRQSLVGVASWQGSAAEAFRTSELAVRRDFDEFVVQFERCAAALSSYAHRLEGHRGEAGVLLTRLLDAYQRLKAASSADGGLVDDVTQAFRQGDATFDIVRLRGERELLALRHRDAVNDAVGALKVATGDNRFGSLVGFTDDAFSTLKNAPVILHHEVQDFLRDNANAIASVGDAASDIGLVVGLGGLAANAVPVVGQAVAAGAGGVAATLSGVALALHSVGKASGASDVGWDDIGSDAAGILPLAKSVDGLADSEKLIDDVDDVATAGQGVKEGLAAAGEDENAFSRLGDNIVPDSPVERLVSWGGKLSGHPEVDLGIVVWNYAQDGHEKDLLERGVTAR